MNKTAYVYVNEHSVSPSLICPICLDVLQEPHTHIPCDSAFCHSCLLQLAEPFCPICRWTWNSSVPLHHNIHLPKASRLIRNMLDDLPVRCVHCHTIRRRGQFEHDCQKISKSLRVLNIALFCGEDWRNLRVAFSTLVIGLFLTLVYYYRHYVFEKAIDDCNQSVNKIGYNIDSILLANMYSFTMKMIEYPITIMMINLCLWFTVVRFGDRLTSKTNSRILTKFFEIVIIANLIIYSIHH